ncbi:nucleoplasmin-like protein isoform X1 [Anthonomus grandis grandis]|uniref:nucleoplasmin-like protein isoform X1 n=1 Tax=Anthonomus grandis grandis TaxID=2921223 RepID=UPI002166B03A|nr:nucleoplasmin-like protein isoform X1 [Anthonomus grandis grandis]
MADEYFFALTLKGKSANEVWDPEAKGAGAEDYQGGHKLIIKQALLGPDATEGEVNVIQVEAMTWKDSVKIPVATLKAGSANNQVLLDLSFPDPPVTFTLIQGNGPVHIIGHHLIGGPIEEFDEMDEMEEEMIEDDEGDVEGFLGGISLQQKLGEKLGDFIAKKLASNLIVYVLLVVAC